MDDSVQYIEVVDLYNDESYIAFWYKDSWFHTWFNWIHIKECSFNIMLK